MELKLEYESADQVYVYWILLLNIIWHTIDVFMQLVIYVIIYIMYIICVGFFFLLFVFFFLFDVHCTMHDIRADLHRMDKNGFDVIQLKRNSLHICMLYVHAYIKCIWRAIYKIDVANKTGTTYMYIIQVIQNTLCTEVKSMFSVRWHRRTCIELIIIDITFTCVFQTAFWFILKVFFFFVFYVRWDFVLMVFACKMLVYLFEIQIE